MFLISILSILVLFVAYILLWYKYLNWYLLDLVRTILNSNDLNRLEEFIDNKRIYTLLLKKTVLDQSLEFWTWVYHDWVLRYNLNIEWDQLLFLLAIFIWEKIEKEYKINIAIDNVFEFNFKNNEKKKQLLTGKMKKLNVWIYFLYEELKKWRFRKYELILEK